MRIKIPRQINIPIDDTAWEKPPWRKILAHGIQNHMGETPDHFPRAEVKIAYDETSISLMFRVADRYVRAVAVAHQDNVCQDSCVEFFFTPDSDLSKGYFNLEMNCGGTMLFHFQPGQGKGRIIIPTTDCSRIKVAHSLPKIIHPEIRESVTWTVAYSIPMALVEKYCAIIPPGPQVEWRGNFYKCGDRTSHPHWLTWAPVDFPKPNFHLPRAFGILEFL